MTITDREFTEAEERADSMRRAGHAVSARYDRRRARIVIQLNTGLELTFPAKLAEGLAGARPDDLAKIDISPAGLGLHWPTLDADLYVPSLLQGIFGSTRWMAAQIGAVGGKARSAAKAATSRENGRKGGRPAKIAAAQ